MCDGGGVRCFNYSLIFWYLVVVSVGVHVSWKVLRVGQVKRGEERSTTILLKVDYPLPPPKKKELKVCSILYVSNLISV